MKAFSITILLGFIALLGCHQDKMVGGPCSYETTYYPAKVIAIAAVDSTMLNLLFEVKMGENLDTLDYHELNSSYLTRQEAEASKVVEGKVFSLAHDHIVSGTCTPEIQRIELKPYQAAH